MTREAEVVRSLVEMADTLVDDYDVVDLLTGVADRCVTLLGVSAAGVMLASPAGSLGLIGRAKWRVAERAGSDLAAAFARLRAYARNHNLRLTDVAQTAIDGTLDPLAWAAV